MHISGRIEGVKRWVKKDPKDATKKEWKNFENLSKEEIIQNGGGGERERRCSSMSKRKEEKFWSKAFC